MQTSTFEEYSTIKTKPRSRGTWHEGLLPHFFREGPRQLYACLHLPAAASAKTKTVLICNATGHEYERCHRAMRKLSSEIARTGNHAMRFDYFGTGDSAGKCVEISLKQWREDIDDAIDDCKILSGSERICIVGLRLGATLAAQAAAKRKDIDGLVLYAPVIDGNALLAEWEHEQAKFDRDHGHYRHANNRNEILGFPITKAFRAELTNGLALPKPSSSLRRVLVIAEDVEENGAKMIEDILESSGAKVSIVPANEAAIWRREPNEANVPFKLLRHIVQWLV